MKNIIVAVKKLLFSYQEQVSYLFFGVLTTIVNYAVFWILSGIWNDRYVLLVNLVAFLAATAFAYITNKLFVFHSCSWKPTFVLREALSFVSARLFSFGIEEAGLYICVYALNLGQYMLGCISGTKIAKVVLSVVAVILNYFFSKFLVFTKKNGEV